MPNQEISADLINAVFCAAAAEKRAKNGLRPLNKCDSLGSPIESKVASVLAVTKFDKGQETVANAAAAAAIACKRKCGDYKDSDDDEEEPLYKRPSLRYPEERRPSLHTLGQKRPPRNLDRFVADCVLLRKVALIGCYSMQKELLYPTWVNQARNAILELRGFSVKELVGYSANVSINVPEYLDDKIAAQSLDESSSSPFSSSFLGSIPLKTRLQQICAMHKRRLAIDFGQGSLQRHHDYDMALLPDADADDDDEENENLVDYEAGYTLETSRCEIAKALSEFGRVSKSAINLRRAVVKKNMLRKCGKVVERYLKSLQK